MLLPTHILPMIRHPAIEAWTTGIVSDSSPSKTLWGKTRSIRKRSDSEATLWRHISGKTTAKLEVSQNQMNNFVLFYKSTTFHPNVKSFIGKKW